MNRRSFVKRGLLGGALLALGGSVGLAAWPSQLGAQPRRKLQALDARQFAILAAVAARTVAAPGADAIEIAHLCDERLALAYPEARADVGKLLLLLENGLAGLLFDGRPQPFTRLDAGEQVRALEHWRDSRLAVRRGGYAILRRLTESVWYAAPQGWEGTGYPGPPTIAVKS
jgi:hypothetical protein